MINIDAAPIRIAHAELVRASDESLFRSKCMKCKDGVMLVYREEGVFSGRLRAEDNCIGCGQRYIYTDIDRLRRLDGKC